MKIFNDCVSVAFNATFIAKKNAGKFLQRLSRCRLNY